MARVLIDRRLRRRAPPRDVEAHLGAGDGGGREAERPLDLQAAGVAQRADPGQLAEVGDPRPRRIARVDPGVGRRGRGWAGRGPGGGIDERRRRAVDRHRHQEPEEPAVAAEARDADVVLAEPAADRRVDHHRHRVAGQVAPGPLGLEGAGRRGRGDAHRGVGRRRRRRIGEDQGRGADERRIDLHDREARIGRVAIEVAAGAGLDQATGVIGHGQGRADGRGRDQAGVEQRAAVIEEHAGAELPADLDGHDVARRGRRHALERFGHRGAGGVGAGFEGRVGARSGQEERDERGGANGRGRHGPSDCSRRAARDRARRASASGGAPRVPGDRRPRYSPP